MNLLINFNDGETVLYKNMASIRRVCGDGGIVLEIEYANGTITIVDEVHDFMASESI